MINSNNYKNAILLVSLAAILFYVLRGSSSEGDFVGYVNAGHLALNGENIYNDYLNTWPPFFSVLCMPLSLLDKLSSFGIRLIWLLLSVVAMFWLMKITVKWIYNKQLQVPFAKSKHGQISFSSNLVLIPFLLLLRFLLDNLANVQINIFLLLGCILVVDCFIKRKDLIAGLLLAFIISLKVFPVFLLLYFIFKRAYKLTGWTLVFLMLFNCITLMVFGFEQGLAYFSHWWNEIATQTNLILHKNQSFFSMLASWMMDESQGLGIHLNFIDLPLETVKRVGYLALFVLALIPMFLFRSRFNNRNDSKSQLEYVFILTAIPVLSPLAWKAYFIFLWPGYLYSYFYLYYSSKLKNFKIRKRLRVIFLVSVLFTVVTTDLFLGPYLADVMEVFSTITVGTILLLIILIVLHVSEKMNILNQELEYS